MSGTLQNKNKFKSEHRNLATVDIDKMTTLTDCIQRYIWRIITAHIDQEYWLSQLLISAV